MPYFPRDESDQGSGKPAGVDTTGAQERLAFLRYVTLVLIIVGFGNSREFRNSVLFFPAVIRSRGSRLLRTLFNLARDIFSLAK